MPVLALLVSICVAFIDFSSLCSARSIRVIILAVALLIVYVIVLALYARLDEYNQTIANEHEQTLHDCELRFKELDENYRGLSQILKNWKALNLLVAENVGVLSLAVGGKKAPANQYWPMHDILSKTCQNIYTYLSEIYSSEQIEVTYVVVDAISKSMELIAYDNSKKDDPSIKNQKLPLRADQSTEGKYCFETILLKKDKQDPVIFENEDEIREKFFFKDEETKRTCKYKQYIGIPIYKRKHIPIGLLQIVSFEDGLFGDRAKMIESVWDVLGPYAYNTLVPYEVNCAYTVMRGGGK